MGKKANGVTMLIAAFLDAVIGYGWYITLYPTKAMRAMPSDAASIWGAILMLFTLAALITTAMVYMITVAEESYTGFFTIKTRVERSNSSETQSCKETANDPKRLGEGAV